MSIRVDAADNLKSRFESNEDENIVCEDDSEDDFEEADADMDATSAKQLVSGQWSVVRCLVLTRVIAMDYRSD